MGPGEQRAGTQKGWGVVNFCGELIYHEPSLVGRSTTVPHAKSPKWKDKDLVVKVSWPSVGKSSKSEFLKKAIKEAKRTPNEWAVNHLPDLVFDLDLDFDPDSTHGKVASMFEDAEFVDGKYKYEWRVLRITVHGRLYPLKTLADAKEIAQVLLDVACSAYFHSPLGYHRLMLV